MKLQLLQQYSTTVQPCPILDSFVKVPTLMWLCTRKFQKQMKDDYHFSSYLSEAACWCRFIVCTSSNTGTRTNCSSSCCAGRQQSLCSEKARTERKPLPLLFFNHTKKSGKKKKQTKKQKRIQPGQIYHNLVSEGELPIISGACTWVFYNRVMSSAECDFSEVLSLIAVTPSGIVQIPQVT